MPPIPCLRFARSRRHGWCTWLRGLGERVEIGEVRSLMGWFPQILLPMTHFHWGRLATRCGRGFPDRLVPALPGCPIASGLDLAYGACHLLQKVLPTTPSYYSPIRGAGPDRCFLFSPQNGRVGTHGGTLERTRETLERVTCHSPPAHRYPPIPPQCIPAYP